jgi:uncharacterized protein (TIRG00374 family)
LRLDLKKFDWNKLVPIFVVLVALAGVVFVVLDWSKIKPALTQADWRLIPFALLATAISYACISFSFAKVSKLLGVVMQMKELSIVGFISTALNHIFLSGGAAGYSVRFMLMNRYGVSVREVMAITIIHFYLTALWMILMFPVSLIYLALNASLSKATATLLAITGAILLVLVNLASILIFSSKARKRLIQILIKAAHSFIHREIDVTLERFDDTMDQGILAMRQQPFSLVIIASLIVIDWVFSAAALWFCFRALNLTPSPGQLLSGFVIGTMAGVASVLPGGLGVQEASMTGIFALYGIPVERAALVAILYRVVYTIIPYLVSLGFYRAVLSRHRTRQLEQEGSRP